MQRAYAPAFAGPGAGDTISGDERDRREAAEVTFDEALAALLTLVGQRVEVHVMDAGESPHLVATFAGTLQAGYSTSGGEPDEGESIFVRIDAGEENASVILDREVYREAIVHPDGGMNLQMGTTELAVMAAPRDPAEAQEASR
ncbi:MAG: hypothetical protein M9964_03400 [Solirubrobacterales bacterium]|nr:hypothetical protein [Solirubrobacterales bacterium]